MSKLSKNQIKLHQQAEEYLKKDVLTFDEKIFVFKNWNESAENINSFTGAFFTPIGLAKDFSICLLEGVETVDLCAGIGMLSFFAYHYKGCKVTCIEINPDYVRVGKKLLPEANWINASIFDQKILSDLPKFEQSISNPPFGKIKSGISVFNSKYKGKEFEYLTIEIASQISNEGTFILPQLSTPFKYSGNKHYEEVEPCLKLSKFLNESGYEMTLSVGIDTSIYLKDWKGVKPLCEIINIDFDKKYEPQKPKNKVIESQEISESDIEMHRDKYPIEVNEIRYYSSFEQILGKSPKDYSPEHRKIRWEKCMSEMDNYDKKLSDYWRYGSEEGCEGCIHRDLSGNHWCKLQELPCLYNPVTKIPGMACFGTGKEIAQQIKLFN